MPPGPWECCSFPAGKSLVGRGKPLCHCARLAEHFACESPSLCTLLLSVALLLVSSYLVAISSKLFLSQPINFAFCASSWRGREARGSQHLTGVGAPNWGIPFLNHNTVAAAMGTGALGAPGQPQPCSQLPPSALASLLSPWAGALPIPALSSPLWRRLRPCCSAGTSGDAALEGPRGFQAGLPTQEAPPAPAPSQLQVLGAPACSMVLLWMVHGPAQTRLSSAFKAELCALLPQLCILPVLGDLGITKGPQNCSQGSSNVC